MRSSTITAFAAAVIGVLAAPAHVHVVHEKRTIIPEGWAHSHKLPAHVNLPMRIGLTQSNLENLEDYLMDVSDPESPNWGDHWSMKKVAKTFAPTRGTVDAVRNWLTSSGIAADRIILSPSLGWLKLNASVAEVESLLQTEYNVYEHLESGTRQVACMDYNVPEHVQKHIDFITPTVAFDTKILPPSERNLRKRGSPHELINSNAIPIAMQGNAFPSMDTLAKRLENCTDYITPACLRALYGIPIALTNVQNDPLGIVEYTTQSYYQPDLNLFFDTFSPKQKQTTPNLASIDGGFISNQPLGFGLNGESNLDLEYSMALVNPITVTVYQVGDQVEGGSFNTFLDAIDGSYCTFEGGDAPYDPKYPDPYTNYYGAYEGPENCGGFAPPKVVSTSYAYPTEYYLPAFYMQRQCAEYAKLGLMGTSVLYSSGDTGVGVSGTTARCPAQNSTFGDPFFTTANNSRFTVSFPSNCPYITSVGATQVKANTSVLAANPEQAADVPLPQGNNVTFFFSSGGGFSDLFSVPNYQKKAVKSYLKNYPPPYSGTRFNNTGKSRGAPDVSANGANYVITVNGTFSLVYGTSASSPTFASIITLINQQRKQHNKASIGFINPALYNNPELLTDITEGNNPGCGTTGFAAQPGWDPVTGLGTPNVPRMLDFFLKLKGAQT